MATKTKIMAYGQEFKKFLVGIAKGIKFTPTARLTSTDVQGAIEEVDGKVDDLTNYSFSPKELGAIIDVNTIHSGIVYVNSRSVNIPVNKWGWLTTINDAIRQDKITNVGIQYFNPAEADEVYIRRYHVSYGGWQSWQRLVTSGEIEAVTTSTITADNGGLTIDDGFCITRNKVCNFSFDIQTTKTIYSNATMGLLYGFPAPKDNREISIIGCCNGVASAVRLRITYSNAIKKWCIQTYYTSTNIPSGTAMSISGTYITA